METNACPAASRPTHSFITGARTLASAVLTAARGERSVECGRGGSGGGEREVALKSSRFIYIYTLVEKQVGSAGTEFRSQIPSADNIHGAELFISDF